MPIKFRPPVCGLYKDGKCLNKKPFLLLFGGNCHYIFGDKCEIQVSREKALIFNRPPPPPPPPPIKNEAIEVNVKVDGKCQYDINDVVERLDKLIELVKNKNRVPTLGPW